ncbi:CbiX protein [Staphylococcus aureus]|uniref:sirohydrochlorin chelatase n=1 Tax=Staphylococcus aureus TaxID=1280 RepID=UPI0007CA77EC|nr:sirohydrochlorin chelatase [Staphylococcus aureus]EJX3544079.1 sirohydrochlorin chelatase [Staphylococcus aureus]MCQ1228984.1 sirohydrochlorin chelatase [Staphylococcus aureus]MCS5415302.1 sirohydrochlorin chelatase [Staphylococcus aureus]QFZ08349.1 sirohydrochlorin chelatase [Staphylococcus aureus]SBD60641.1 CbiX protein [Staphylococcus aureus]
MNGNIIVAHGMRRGRQNQALEAFISELVKDDIHHYDIAFLESEHQDLETVMTTLIQNGVKHFKIVPLLIFSAMHYLKDIPNIIREMKQMYPDITVEVSKPLGTHPLMTEIIMQRIDDALVDEEQQVGIVVVAHGNINGKFTKAHEELQICAQNLQISKPTYARTLYGEISFTHDLESISKRYQKLIVVPLFLYDGRLVNKVKQQMNDMVINTDIHFTPSINFDPILKQIINDRLESLMIPMKI